MLNNQTITYAHKGICFEWVKGLDLYLPNKLYPLKMQLNNGVLSWRLNRNTWLSINQFKNILKSDNLNSKK